MNVRNILYALGFILLTAGLAHADLNAYIRDLNISAKGDIGGYKAQLGARFGTSNSNLEIVFRSVDSPADVAIVLWLGEQCRQPLETVLHVYRSQKAKGWGAMAQRLGIKPGSSTFHALKQGNLKLYPVSTGGSENSKAKGKGKNKVKKKNKHG